MAKVTFKITTRDKFEHDNPPIVDGQIMFVANPDETMGKIYLDFNGKRQCFTPSGLNYVGIADE